MADLEAPEPVAPPPAAPVAEPLQDQHSPIEAAPPADPDPEGTVEVAGEKLAPVGAVIAERKERQRVERELNEVRGQVEKWTPFMTFLTNNPGLMQREAPAPVTPAQPEDDPAAVELARTLDLYTSDGKPDAVRAQKIRSMVKQSAQEEAQALVRPVQENTVRAQAAQMLERALATPAADGRKANPEVLKQIWSQADPRVLATEQGAAAALMLAFGASAATAAPVPVPPANAPVVTEAIGGRVGGRAPMTDLDTKIANIRGLDPKTYADRVSGFRPGEPSVLED
jgi:hypothetical protein